LMEKADTESGRDFEKPDLILAGNLMDLAQFKAFTPWPDLPHILYVHENQLDYPIKAGEKRDFHYAWKDYTNFLAADGLIFNSAYNLESFLEKFRDFSARLPDSRPSDPSDVIRAKSKIIPPGCRLVNPAGSGTASESQIGAGLRESAPVILWNQRWEHDKNPEEFFRFLRELKKRETPFRLIVAGESYKDSPSCFSDAEEEFNEELIHMGYAESREVYDDLLRQSDIVVSTAVQENFGISVVEAVSAGCLPLLPRRLAYPEVLSPKFHGHCLYRNKNEMMERFLVLKKVLEKGPEAESLRTALSKSVEKYSWDRIIPRFDSLLGSIAGRGSRE
ncbi:MAG: DUF3524 domain-containing protein, partial [Spirochaetales bacterium]|nr:DUF3524 domain-containing protein [Spirochaetales bacterium]